MFKSVFEEFFKKRVIKEIAKGVFFHGYGFCCRDVYYGRFYRFRDFCQGGIECAEKIRNIFRNDRFLRILLNLSNDLFDLRLFRGLILSPRFFSFCFYLASCESKSYGYAKNDCYDIFHIILLERE